jgi:hypothetical protein
MRDLQSFQKSQPFDLIPLSISGAYTSPPVPDTFDFETASPDEMARYGFHVPRPGADQPELLAAWKEIFGRKWKATDQIVPVLQVQKGKSHALRSTVQIAGGTNGNGTSLQWSGAITPNRTGAPLPAEGNKLDGYCTPWDDQQHVNYVGADNNVYELYYNRGWIFNNLTQLAGSPPAAPGSSVAGYVTPYNYQQHVIYIGNDNNIHELMIQSGQPWISNNLTQPLGAPAPIPGSPLVGYVTEANKQQHIDYIGADQHVHELVYGNGWAHNDLTHASGAPVVQPGSQLAGYETAYNGQQHVIFLDANLHIHELVWGGGHWAHDDVTQSAAGAPGAAWPANAIAGYVTTFNNQQHIVYLGNDNHVHELVYSNGWVHNDLTHAAGGPSMATGGGLHGYQTPYNSQQHVNYVGIDDHVHELYYNGSWHDNDLTAIASGSPPLAARTALTGYVTMNPNQPQQHVNFVGVDGHVHELWYDSQWHQNDLTKIAAVPWVTAVGTWNIPAVSQPSEPPGSGFVPVWDSSSWVGIDGWNKVSNDVLQAGIEQAFSVAPFYVAWFEWFAPPQSGSPDYIYQVNINNSGVTAGHTVYVVAQYINNFSAGTLLFINKTAGRYFTITLAPPPGASFTGASMEWIMEAPNGGEPATSIPKFTPIVFSPAYGHDVHNSLGNPSNGFAVNLTNGSKVLTNASISGQQVTIDFVG